LSVPSEIASYFTSEETLLKQWSSKDWDIYATQYRIFLYKSGILSKQVVEAAYEHISSIELTRKRPLSRFASAIILFVTGFLLILLDPTQYYYYYTGPPIYQYMAVVLFLVGVGFLAWFIIGIQGFTLHIVGRKPIVIPKELTEMVRFIREKRPQEVYMRKPESQPVKIKETIREVVMIPCEYCNGLMPQTSTFCPNCGARRKRQNE